VRHDQLVKLCLKELLLTHTDQQQCENVKTQKPCRRHVRPQSCHVTSVGPCQMTGCRQRHIVMISMGRMTGADYDPPSLHDSWAGRTYTVATNNQLIKTHLYSTIRLK